MTTNHDRWKWARMFSYYNSNVVIDIPAPPPEVLVAYLQGSEAALVEYLRDNGCEVWSTVEIDEELAREYAGIPRNEVAILASIFKEYVDRLEDYVEDTEHYSYMVSGIRNKLDSSITHVPSFQVAIYPPKNS